MADGDGTQISGHSFPSNTNTLDRNSMPSREAEAARQKSSEVMAALNSGEPGAADKAMGKSSNKLSRKSEKRSSGDGFGGWLKRKLGPGDGGSGKLEKSKGSRDEEISGIEGLKGTPGGIGVEDSTGGTIIGDPAPAGDVMSRDGGQGDGVIR